MADSEMSITFDFRDWKYMSHFIRFAKTFSDPEIVAGLKEGSITVDFKNMTESDATKGSKYEVGGRVFYEAHAFAIGCTSFTTNGFFDRLGYVEPLMSSTSSEFPVAAIVIVLILVVSVGIYLCSRKPKSLDLDAEGIKI